MFSILWTRDRARDLWSSPKVVLILNVLLQQILFAFPYDYCYGPAERILCGGSRHIACDTDFNKKNAFITVMPPTNTIKNQILSRLNKQRNILAGARGASCLRRFYWDEELAMLAEMHARKCTTRKPHCVATVRFKYATVGQSATVVLFREDLKVIIGELFDNFNRANEHIYLTDANGHVGCSIGYCQEILNEPPYENHFYFLVCVFADGTNPPTFRYGYITDQCYGAWGMKKDKEYELLCENDGSVRDRGYIYSPKLLAKP